MQESKVFSCPLGYLYFSSERAIKGKPGKQMAVAAACMYVKKVILLLLIFSLIKLCEIRGVFSTWHRTNHTGKELSFQ